MRLFISLILSAFVFGCGTTYYQVRDPSSGSTYYTTQVEEEKGGAVTLKDHRTNAQVTIQNSEVMEMTADQYDAAIRTIVAPESTPAPAADPASGS